MFFAYGEKEITYLKRKDKRLAEIIDKIGMIEREVDTDLFSAVIVRAALFIVNGISTEPVCTGNHLEKNEWSVWYH